MFPTRAQLFEVGANEILSRAESRPVGDRITPEQVWTPGSDINLILAGGSAMAEEVARASSRDISNLTLDGASGEDLDRLVADRYAPELVRKTASQALVSLQFTRPTAAYGAITLTTGTVCRTSSGVAFETLADVAFGVADVGPINVNAEAVEAGTDGNVDAGTITSFRTPPADNSILVTNPNVAAGGDFTESDESLRDRCRAFYGSARRGILDAIEFGALTVPGVRQAFAEEELDSLGIQTGIVSLYIADANGQSNDVLNQLVYDALLEYRGGGIVVDVYGAVPTFQAIVLDLSYTAGTDTAAAFNQVRQIVVARVNSLKPGETLLISLISSAAKSVSGVIVADDAVQLPTGDVVPTSGQIIRTRADLVTPATS